MDRTFNVLLIEDDLVLGQMIHENYVADTHCSECSTATGSRMGRGDAAQLPTIQ
jgi:hypothetical protein